MTQYHINPKALWTPSEWYNSETYKVSYKRNYKVASSTIVSMLGDCTTTATPKFERRFTVIRAPVSRAASIYCEMVHMKKEKHGMFMDWLYKIKEEGFDDKHQFPQCFWLEDEDLEGMKFFWLSDLHAAMEWATGAKVEIPLPKLNRSGIEKEFSLAEENIILEIWKADYDFFSKILFQ